MNPSTHLPLPPNSLVPPAPEPVGAFGLIVLADNAQPDPVGEVLRYLQAFAPHVPARRTVVGVGRLDTPGTPGINEYCERLSAQGFNLPVLEVDVRRDADVRLLLSVLVSMAEVEYEQQQR